MTELQKDTYNFAMAQGDFACAGLRGIQQVRRSRSSSRTTKGGKARNNINQARTHVSKPGFEAELLAAKLFGLGKLPALVAACQQQSTAITAAPLQLSAPLEQEQPSSFRKYYQQHFNGNTICMQAMDNLYKSIVRKVVVMESATPQVSSPVKFRFKPSVGTWNLVPQFEAECAVAEIQNNSATPFQKYYQTNFKGNCLSSSVLEGLYAQMKPPAAELKDIEIESAWKRYTGARDEDESGSDSDESDESGPESAVQPRFALLPSVAICRHIPLLKPIVSIAVAAVQETPNDQIRTLAKQALLKAASSGKLEKALAAAAPAAMELRQRARQCLLNASQAASSDQIRTLAKQALLKAASSGKLEQAIAAAAPATMELRQRARESLLNVSQQAAPNNQIFMLAKQALLKAASSGELEHAIAAAAPGTMELRQRARESLLNVSQAAPKDTIFTLAKQALLKAASSGKLEQAVAAAAPATMELRQRARESLLNTSQVAPSDQVRILAKQALLNAASSGKLEQAIAAAAPVTVELRQRAHESLLRALAKQALLTASCSGKLGQAIAAAAPATMELRERARMSLLQASLENDLSLTSPVSTEEVPAVPAPSCDNEDWSQLPSVGTWMAPRFRPKVQEPTQMSEPAVQTQTWFEKFMSQPATHSAAAPVVMSTMIRGPAMWSMSSGPTPFFI